ncbi:MAG TPA: molybdenum cofactor biosynthesis protein MoaE [Candidatus Eremiobacteraceae bacterium]|nr:molybdenum cofactor biosynthesis protein MoaE [Candidatus Eremiobacteraceae bacterium]
MSAKPLDVTAIAASVASDGDGAVVTFVGRVRSRSRGRDVSLLEYEAYPEMIDGVFRQIADEAHEKFAVHAIAIHHRIGTLAVGDASVVIAVAAEHRAAAFDGCKYAIDRLKHIAPIWKKEHGPDGAVWVEDRP